MGWAIRAALEGFYGTPWTWDERVFVARACAELKLTHYVYAPKDDLKHREHWREPYERSDLDGFERLRAASHLGVGFGISPGLDIDLARRADRDALAAKVDQVVGLGIDLVVLALDDLPIDPRGPAVQGAGHGALSSWLRQHLGDRAALALIPTDYVGTESSPYLDALAGAVPADVPIGWTGRFVVNDRVTTDDARRRGAALGGRPPLLWDNYPVNDALMVDRLFLGPLRGRDPTLGEECCGYLANAMVQPRSSLLPLASIAAFLDGGDPEQGWLAAAGDLRVLAEACDGMVPESLARRFLDDAAGPGWCDAARPLAGWLTAAARCGAPGLDGEANGWLDQVHREAKVALSALRLIRALRPAAVIDESGGGRLERPDADAASAEAFALSVTWPRARRSAHTVLGVRGSFRPVLSQWPNGQWRFHTAALDRHRNITDLLVDRAFAALGDQPSPAEASGGAEIRADGAMIPVAEDDTFQVPAASTVTVRLGRHQTRLAVPAPPLIGHLR